MDAVTDETHATLTRDGLPRAKRRTYALPSLETSIARTLDARRLNVIANHPDVRPWLGGDGPLDLTDLVELPDNIAVEAEHGGFLGVALGGGRYEVHSLFEPSGRGAEAITAMVDAVGYVFGATDCVELVTKIPTNNSAAAALAMRAGFERRFTSPLAWSGGTSIETHFLGLSLERWALRAAVTERLGGWFHRQLVLAQRDAGATEPPHPYDTVHDRMVGAAVWMLRAGNARKAVLFYNQWAAFAGYEPILLLRDQPIVIDVQTAILEVRSQEVEVLRCR